MNNKKLLFEKEIIFNQNLKSKKKIYAFFWQKSNKNHFLYKAIKNKTKYVNFKRISLTDLLNEIKYN